MPGVFPLRTVFTVVEVPAHRRGAATGHRPYHPVLGVVKDRFALQIAGQKPVQYITDSGLHSWSSSLDIYVLF